MEERLYTVSEVADYYGVTSMAVRHWIRKGLKTETEKVIGIKPRMVIDLKDVEEFLGLKGE
jgi:transposase-like protein